MNESRSDRDYAEAAVINEKAISAAVQWLMHDAAQRTRYRQFGRQELIVHWEDGHVRFVHINQQHVIKAGQPCHCPAEFPPKPD